MDLINLIAALVTIILFIASSFILGYKIALKKDPLSYDMMKKVFGLFNGHSKRFFIGIDIGSDTIDYCLLDFQNFSEEVEHGVQSDEIIAKKSAKFAGNTPNPATNKENFALIYPKIGEIITEITNKAMQKGYVPISGIGIGLPGMVQPENGLLVHSPSFGVHNIDFVTELTKHITQGSLTGLLPKYQKHLPNNFIRIDNDVRCATRFKWKATSQQKNLLCVFIGNGLGSGIVLDGKMIYGTHFSAGEAGHTTISYTPRLFKDELEKCHCGKKGHHWEMYVASYGVVNLMKKIDPEKFKQFKKTYCSDGKFTTRKIADAYKEKYPYAVDIVENEFCKYLAIGISNYINILNPEKIILGGGMIRAFLSTEAGRQMIQNKIHDYALEVGGDILTDVTGKQYLAGIGAALIFEDDSYSEYVEKHQHR